MAHYLPLAHGDRAAQCAALGIADPMELYADVPGDLLLPQPPDDGGDEWTVTGQLERLAAANTPYRAILRGAGAYDHIIPAVVDDLAGRSEFVTAYTPYQAEISQGILQGIFEYQTLVCRLFGMDVANASVYDGATAAGEALAMCADGKRGRALVSQGTPPHVLAVMRTYAKARGVTIDVVPVADMQPAAEVASIYVHTPNYRGLWEDLTTVRAACDACGAKMIVGVNPTALGLMPPPDMADIVVGDGQPLGMPLAFGGPYIGLMACKKAMMRSLPGRIVGRTVDGQGRRAYCLTLQAREQHIRREKAKSSICSNQAHCALRVGIYAATMGGQGLMAVAQRCYDNAHYAAEAFAKVGFVRADVGDFFHEFVTTSKVSSSKVLDMLKGEGILGGLALSEHELLWCFTEKHDKALIDKVAQVLAAQEVKV